MLVKLTVWQGNDKWNNQLVNLDLVKYTSSYKLQIKGRLVNFVKLELIQNTYLVVKESIDDILMLDNFRPKHDQ
jgi:hypothetical protein